jgi:long-chain acyl-CoA synthetase
VGAEARVLGVDSREVGCADHTGIVDELRGNKGGFGVVATCRKVGEVGLADRVEQQITGNGNPSPENEELRVEDRAKAGAGLAKPAAQLPQGVKRPGVTGSNESADELTVERALLGTNVCQGVANPPHVGDFVRHTQQGSAGTVLLDAATGSAATGKAVGHNAHVADLGARSETAAEETVVGDDCPADSGADGKHRHIADQTARAETELCPTGGVRVVVDRDRQVHTLGEPPLQRLIAPVDVRGVVDHRLRSVDESCSRDARGDDLFAHGELLNHFDNNVDDGSGVSRRGGRAVLAEDLSLVGNQRSRDFGPADINSDCMHLCSVYRPGPVLHPATSPLFRSTGRVRPDTLSGAEGVTVKQHDAPALVAADPDANATVLLTDRVDATPDLPLFAVPSADGGWTDVTGREFLAQVRALAKGLVAAGVEPGDKLALMCKTRYEWTLIDFAVWFAGAVLVPVYETSSPSQIRWNLEDSGAIAILTETADHFARFDEIQADVPLVRNVWKIDLGALDKLAAAGVEVPDAEIDRRKALATGSDMATLIYTSGSTGRPKGCVITHSNFIELSRNAAVKLREVVHPGASTVLFITTAHIFARFISILCVHAGVKVGHQGDTRQLLPAMASFRPTFLLAVPRVFEKVYNSSEQKAESSGRGKIFRRAADIAVQHSKALDAGVVPLSLRLQFALYDRLVLSKIRAALGGRVQYAVSGSAPLGLRLGHFYRSLGLTILEGYGLTETTAPISVNLPSGFKIGTVGPPLPGVSVRIAEDGEVQAKGINIFGGYWNNDAATAESFDGEWFRTGDIGEFDENGYLTITGRKKEIIVTAGGKNVAPAALEDPIRANSVVGQVVAVGEQRPFISALITLDPEMLPVWLHNNGVAADLPLAEACVHPLVVAEVQRAVDTANGMVSRAESIRKFRILATEFTENSGHLTPKLSIKRAVILTDFATEIEAMYSASPETQGQSLVS